MTGPSQPDPAAAQPPYAPPGWGAPEPAWQDPGSALPGYGPAPVQPYGAGYAPTETETKAVVALVLAIASFAAFPLIPAIAALFVGTAARRDIEASGGRLTGERLVRAARVIAWINIGLCVAALIGIVVLVVMLAGSGFSEG